MEQQLILDKVYNAITQQGSLANTEENGCFYIGEIDGIEVRCGIGHIIDECTARNWARKNDASVTSIIQEYKDRDASMIPEKYRWMASQESFLQDIQDAHDFSMDVEGFQKRMQRLARKYSLESPDRKCEGVVT